MLVLKHPQFDPVALDLSASACPLPCTGTA